MSADQEVRQDRLTRSTRFAIVRMGMAGKERGGQRNLLDVRHRRKRRVQFLDERKAWRDLGDDDRVEHECSSLSGACELLLRPRKPARVLGEEVEQDAAINEGLHASGRSAAGQREDLLGAHLALPGAAHLADLREGAVTADEQPCAVLVELELDIAAWPDTERPAHMQWDRDLSLLCNSHMVILASNTSCPWENWWAWRDDHALLLLCAVEDLLIAGCL